MAAVLKIALVLAFILVSGCGAETRPEVRGRDGAPTSTSNADEPTRIAKGELVRPTAPGTLENKPAPFDPCTVLGWSDLPPEVRHPDLRPPQPWRGPESNPTLVDAGCRLVNSQITAGAARSHEVFMVLVAWSSGLLYDATAYPGEAEPASIGGRPALISRSTGHNGISEIRMCYVAMRAAGGGAALEVANNRFRIDECELAVRLARLLAARIP